MSTKLFGSRLLGNFCQKGGPEILESERRPTHILPLKESAVSLIAGSCKSGDQMAVHLLQQANSSCIPALAGVALFGSFIPVS
jgi:hypothetical protein